MNTDLYAAIITVVNLVKTCGMGLHDACRLASWKHGVDTDVLYREITQ